MDDFATVFAIISLVVAIPEQSRQIKKRPN